MLTVADFFLHESCLPAPIPVCSDRLLHSSARFTSLVELNATAGSLPPTTPLSPSAVSAQSLVMSSSAVGAEASVTLTLADTQGLLSGGLDTVTLNIASQVGAMAPLMGSSQETPTFLGICSKHNWLFSK